MAFDSISSITLSKPNIIFKGNDWTLTIVLSKPELVMNINWGLTVVLPKVTFNSTLVSYFSVNAILPKISVSSYYVSDTLYTLTRTLKKPSIIYVVTSPNISYLASTLPKPTITVLVSSEITGYVSRRLPLVNITFNVTLGATATRQTWAFNTITAAHSRYTNYDFNSFFKLGSVTYGINANGDIYKLTGSKDFVGEVTEVNIDAEVVLPTTTYDEQTLKACSDAIIFGRGDGDIEVQVTLDEQQARTGYIVHFDDRVGMHRNRVKIPKGLKGCVWQFKFKNTDSSYFDINMFEVFVKDMQRLK